MLERTNSRRHYSGCRGFYSYFLAPKFNAVWAAIGFLIGAVLAYSAPGIHWYPECHELAYQRTYIPLLITYATGLTALIYCIYVSKKHNKVLSS